MSRGGKPGKAQSPGYDQAVRQLYQQPVARAQEKREALSWGSIYVGGNSRFACSYLCGPVYQKFGSNRIVTERKGQRCAVY